MLNNPLSVLLGLVIAAPLLVPSERLHRWRHLVALAAIGLGVAVAWALEVRGVPGAATPQEVVEGALASAALALVSIRSFFEVRASPGRARDPLATPPAGVPAAQRDDARGGD